MSLADTIRQLVSEKNTVAKYYDNAIEALQVLQAQSLPKGAVVAGGITSGDIPAPRRKFYPIRHKRTCAYPGCTEGIGGKPKTFLGYGRRKYCSVRCKNRMSIGRMVKETASNTANTTPSPKTIQWRYNAKRPWQAKYEKNCLWCKTPFMGKKRNARFCSKPHADLYRKDQIKQGKRKIAIPKAVTLVSGDPLRAGQ